MSLPASLGKPGVSAEQLLEESFALNEPFGIPVLSLRPEEFENDLAALPARLQDRIDHFIADVSHGDPDRAREIRDASKEGCKWIPESLMTSASNAGYKDAHAGWMKDGDGNSMGGMIVEPREATHSLIGSITYLTKIDEKQLALPEVPKAQMRFLSHWHEVAHCSGAYDEPNADRIAAIMARKAFPDSALVQAYADGRALDTLFAINNGNPARRLGIYGWAMVDAVDSVLAMPADEIRDMDEKDILAFRNAPFERKSEVVQQVWDAINKIDDGALKDRDLNRAGKALRQALAGNDLNDNSEARKMASRFLTAIERTAKEPSLSDEYVRVAGKQGTPKYQPSVSTAPKI